jgi:hypothetical protein
MRWVWGSSGAVAVLVAVLFTIQNSARTTQLSLDLWLAAWQLERPVPVPALLWGTLLVGLLVGAVPLWLRSLRLAGRVRELESRQALDQALGSEPRRDPGAW